MFVNKQRCPIQIKQNDIAQESVCLVNQLKMIFKEQIMKLMKINGQISLIVQTIIAQLYIYLHITIITMGSCIQKCCLSQTGTICCNIISVLGILYFVFTWAMFQRQFDYYEFHIPNKSQTRLSVIVAGLIYLMFFIWTLYRLFNINREKKVAAELRHKRSIEQYSKPPSVYEEQDKQPNASSERAMMREE